MREIAMLLAATVVAGGLSAGGGLASADDLTVQACYDNAKPYNKPIGWASFPFDRSWLTATSNCADINIRPNQNTTVYVCFAPSSGGVTCQASRTNASAGKWAVVATKVANGTKFRFQFMTPALQSGTYAA